LDALLLTFMNPRTVFFDLDGTLIDHFSAIHRSYVHTLPQLGLPEPTLGQVRKAVGGGLEQAMLNFVSPEQLPVALSIYRTYFDQTMLDDVVLLPGSRNLLGELHRRKVTCAVLTNKLGDASRSLCQHLGVTDFLQGIYGAKDTPWLKPDRAFSDHALRALGRDSSTALLVGDSPFDVQAGLNGGFPCWAVTTGTHNKEELIAAGASRVYPDLLELGSALLAEY